MTLNPSSTHDRSDESIVTLVSDVDLGIPRPGMQLDADRTAIVITDPQNDFLSPAGVTWGVVGESVTENGTVFLMGIVTRQEAEATVNASRTVKGVQRVVKLFEYMN